MRPNSRSSFREASGTSNFPLPASRARTLRWRRGWGEIRWVVREKIEKAARWANRTGRERSGVENPQRPTTFLGHRRTFAYPASAEFVIVRAASGTREPRASRSRPSTFPRRQVHVLCIVARYHRRGDCSSWLPGSDSYERCCPTRSPSNAPLKSGQFPFPRLIAIDRGALTFFWLNESGKKKMFERRFWRSLRSLFGRWIVEYDGFPLVPTWYMHYFL